MGANYTPQILINRSITIEPNPFNASVTPYPVFDWAYVSGQAVLVANITITLRRLEIVNSQVMGLRDREKEEWGRSGAI